MQTIEELQKELNDTVIKEIQIRAKIELLEEQAKETKPA